MARPKSDKPTKTINSSVRLTPEAFRALIERFGSISNALAWLAVNMPSKDK